LLVEVREVEAKHVGKISGGYSVEFNIIESNDAHAGVDY